MTQNLAWPPISTPGISDGYGEWPKLWNTASWASTKGSSLLKLPRLGGQRSLAREEKNQSTVSKTTSRSNTSAWAATKVTVKGTMKLHNRVAIVTGAGGGFGE